MSARTDYLEGRITTPDSNDELEWELVNKRVYLVAGNGTEDGALWLNKAQVTQLVTGLQAALAVM